MATHLEAQSADQVVLDLNHGAMDAYNNMDINRAGSMLEEALRIAQQSGVSAPLLAQTNMNLAIVYVGGLGDNDGGVRYFVDALCADTSVQLDPLTSTPDIQSVFQVAAARVQQQGCPRRAPNIAPRAAAGTMPMQQPMMQQPMMQQPMMQQPMMQQPMMQQPMMPTAEQSSESELPPGWGQADTVNRAKDFKRGFVQLGFGIGLPWVSPGMLADRDPPKDQVFIHAVNGGRIDDPEALVAAGHADVLRFPGALLGVTDEATGQDVGIQQQNAWEPDRDSYDGYTNTNGVAEPFSSSSCPADGKETGPSFTGVDRPLFPSRYCVRVNKPGFAQQMMMRANFGYFLTRDFSMALLTRFQFAAGQGSFAHLLLGLRAEYMFTKTKARGLMVSGFLGGTLGQIQAQPAATNPTGNEPWIKSGLQGAHIGSNIRYRFTNNIGMYMSPELDMQFPTFLWNIDLTVLGAEFSF
jgi:hypothetical protein